MVVRLRGPILLSLAVVLGSGCLGPRRQDYVATHALSVAARSQEADHLWEAIQETLRRHHLRLDRVDRRAGIITTRPETSQHFFEFWRHDVNTRPDFWEATLNPVRRTVSVSILGARGETWDSLAVVVTKERLIATDRQFNSTVAAYQYFGARLPSTAGDPRVSDEQDRWIPLGRDSAMEDYLLRQILQRDGE